MKRVLYILAAVFALQGVVRADDAKPRPVAISAKCAVCGDECKCAPGVCPGKCPVKAKGDANAAWASKADTVVLCIGVPAIEGAYATGPKAGFTNGVYDFARGADGVYRGQLRVSACVGGRCAYPASVYGFGNPVSPFDAPCASGNCPNVRKR